MNEISSADTTELLEAAVPAAEFTDELSDEALDRATVGGRPACIGCLGTLLGTVGTFGCMGGPR